MQWQWSSIPFRNISSESNVTAFIVRLRLQEVSITCICYILPFSFLPTDRQIPKQNSTLQIAIQLPSPSYYGICNWDRDCQCTCLSWRKSKIPFIFGLHIMLYDPITLYSMILFSSHNPLHSQSINSCFRLAFHIKTLEQLSQLSLTRDLPYTTTHPEVCFVL